MKRILVAVCAFAVIVHATQACALTNMRAGVKGGVNLGTFTGDDTSDPGTRTGFAGGAFIGGGINDQFGLRLEGLYIQKGEDGPFVEPGDDHAHDATVKLDYLEFPLLFTARFPAGEKFAFNLFAGPTFAFNINAEADIKEHNETVDLGDFVKGFEFGAAFGGGIEYMLSSLSVLVDVRYGLGGTSVVDDFMGESIDVKNSGIAVMGGVAFPLGGK